MHEAIKSGQLRKEGKLEEADQLIKALEERVRTADYISIPNINYLKTPTNKVKYNSTIEEVV